MRSQRSAQAVVAGLVARPPATFRDLERLIGRLDIDMTGAEGRGGGVFRPASPFAPGGTTGNVRLGRLRPGVVRTYVGFQFDPHHGMPRNTEQLRPNHVSVSVDLDRDRVRGILLQRFGTPRSVKRDGKETEEFGSWYYLGPWPRPVTLEWQERQPDWALPSVAAGAAETSLAAPSRGWAWGGCRRDRGAAGATRHGGGCHDLWLGCPAPGVGAARAPPHGRCGGLRLGDAGCVVDRRPHVLVGGGATRCRTWRPGTDPARRLGRRCAGGPRPQGRSGARHPWSLIPVRHARACRPGRDAAGDRRRSGRTSILRSLGFFFFFLKKKKKKKKKKKNVSRARSPAALTSEWSLGTTARTRLR